MKLSSKLDVADGVVLWPGAFDDTAQRVLNDTIFALVNDAPFYRPVMPGSGKAFSVEETNFGSLGWIADRRGYRYEPNHPQTGKPWPAIPQTLLDLWDATTHYQAPPQCCLVNLYRDGAKMGLHQDKDEAALNAPVLSVSLGDDALFRIGGTSRKGGTKSVKLRSGDVLMFGGPARLAYHGIDRILPGTSRLVPGGGRINLTLRRITP
jgi:alkylated DNA repair protein (DNA oxidative demethylase)